MVGKVCLLHKEPEGHLSCPLEQYWLPARSLLCPADTNLFWLPCCGSGLASSPKEYYDDLVSGTKLSHYTDAFGFQCDSLPRSFPSQPGDVCAASARHLFLLSIFPALYWVRQQLRPEFGALPSCVISLGYLLPCSFQVSL